VLFTATYIHHGDGKDVYLGEETMEREEVMEHLEEVMEHVEEVTEDVEEVTDHVEEVTDHVEEMKDLLIWPRIQVEKQMKWRDLLYNIYCKVDDEQ